MPISYNTRRGQSERTYQIAMDWTRRVMQLAALATIILYGYLLYGLFMGDVGHWTNLSHDDRLRIIGNIQGAVTYLNVALGILLLTVCILYYDEEPLGYMLIAGSIALYYGMPFLLEQLLGDEFKSWKGGNEAAFTIVNQFNVAALILALPGIILVVRDLILRVTGGIAHKREEFSAMQYGGAVAEQDQPNKALIGIIARCWQLPYCRDAIRKGCPIYHARTRCWRERVGCMCEENVIRHAMDAIIGKELITLDKRDDDKPDPSDPLGAIGSLAIKEEQPEGATAVADKTEEKTEAYPRPPSRPPNPRTVKIPHNPNVPMSVKIQRCKNCVIYNEHQRMKYQFFAPLLVLAVPGIAFLEAQNLSDLLNHMLSGVDKLMKNLALVGNAGGTNLANSLTSIGFANYVVIGSLVVILTTMALRCLEYLIFKVKI